ncbi:MAG TPA: hypothetical protein VIM92_06655, partial [Rhodanobacteraceae bacterium]
CIGVSAVASSIEARATAANLTETLEVQCIEISPQRFPRPVEEYSLMEMPLVPGYCMTAATVCSVDPKNRKRCSGKWNPDSADCLRARCAKPKRQCDRHRSPAHTRFLMGFRWDTRLQRKRTKGRFFPGRQKPQGPPQKILSTGPEIFRTVHEP